MTTTIAAHSGDRSTRLAIGCVCRKLRALWLSLDGARDDRGGGLRRAIARFQQRRAPARPPTRERGHRPRKLFSRTVSASRRRRGWRHEQQRRFRSRATTVSQAATRVSQTATTVSIVIPSVVEGQLQSNIFGTTASGHERSRVTTQSPRILAIARLRSRSSAFTANCEVLWLSLDGARDDRGLRRAIARFNKGARKCAHRRAPPPATKVVLAIG